MLIIKGMLIGIGKIIPGVSGSLLAISMGIYQKLIDSINNFFKNPKQNFIFLFKIGIGILISIPIFSRLILKCLNNYYIITMFFFIGLIIGSFKDITLNINKRKNYIVIITFILILVLGLFNIDNDVNIENNIINFMFYIFVGFMDAIATVVPGISGTATLMMIGAYDNLMNVFSNALNINLFFENIKILLPFSIGMILGVVIMVKLIDYLFKKYKNNTYSAILGFSVSAIALMALKCINSNYTLFELIIAFIALFLGYILTKKINHLISND